MKTALMKQITSTIGDDYLKDLRDDVMNTITMSIPDVPPFLFHRYGKVGSKKGKEKSEIEFAIKNHKKAKLKSGNKFTPLRRKLRARKNFKYFNEQ